MTPLTETLEDNVSAFGLWLSGVAHHLASFGAGMIVFGIVYLIGLNVGDSAGYRIQQVGGCGPRFGGWCGPRWGWGGGWARHCVRNSSKHGTHKTRQP